MKRIRSSPCVSQLDQYNAHSGPSWSSSSSTSSSSCAGSIHSYPLNYKEMQHAGNILKNISSFTSYDRRNRSRKNSVTAKDEIGSSSLQSTPEHVSTRDPMVVEPQPRRQEPMTTRTRRMSARSYTEPEKASTSTHDHTRSFKLFDDNKYKMHVPSKDDLEVVKILQNIMGKK